MRKLTLILISLVFPFMLLNAQTTSNFSFSNVCKGDSTILVSTSSCVGGTIVSLDWDIDSIGIFNDGTGITMKVLLNTSKNYHWVGLRAISDIPDTSIIYQLINLNDLPIADFVIDFPTQCSSPNFFNFYGSTSWSPTGKLTYFWDFDDGTGVISYGPDTSHTYLSSGTYNTKLVVYDLNGCKDSVFQGARVVDSVSADFAISQEKGCLSSTFVFTDLSLLCGTASIMQIAWDTSNDNTYNDFVASNLISVVFPSPGVHNVGLRITTWGGASSTIIKKVTVLPPTIADFNINNDTQCFKNHSFTFTDTSITCDVISSITWDLDNDGLYNDASGASITHSFADTGTYIIGMKVITLGDSAMTSKTVRVNPSPSASFTVNNNLQPITGNTFVFTNTSTIPGTLPPSPYVWDFGDGGSSTSKDPAYGYSAVGTYKTLLTVTTAEGCTDTSSQIMTVIPDLAASFSSATVCLGDSTTLTSTSIGSGIIAYDWDMNNDTQFFEGSGVSIKYRFTTAGTHKVGLLIKTATDSNYTYQDIYVRPLPIPDFTYTNACLGASNILTQNASVTGDTLDNFYWDFGNNGSVDATGSPVSHSFSTPGNNLTKLVVTTKAGCKDSIVKTVPVGYRPDADFNYTIPCFGDSTVFQNLTNFFSDTLLNYLWDYGDGWQAIIKNDPKHLYPAAGTFLVSMVALSTKGCKDTVTKTITIYPKPTAELLPTKANDTTLYLYKGKSITLTVFGSYDSIVWSTGKISSSLDIDAAGKYWARIKDNNGCSDTAYATVIEKTIAKIISNDVMSPNGDGVNDLWIIDDIGAFEPVEVTIFNRWGDKVYENNNYKNDWDGKRNGNGSILPEGTYFYVIKSANGDISKGSINILK